METELRVHTIINSIDYNSEDLSYYEKIKDSILECRYELQKLCGIMWPLPNYFQNELDLIKNHIKEKFSNQKFYEQLIFSESDEVNGYKLYNCENVIMDWLSFTKLAGLYKNSKKLSKKNFIKKCNDTCCTDWCKMDRHGECYGGFWITDKENAWELSQKDNFKGLYELPYPHDLIFETIRIGCGNRMESVRYSNFLCHWVEQKMKQLNML